MLFSCWLPADKETKTSRHREKNPGKTLEKSSWFACSLSVRSLGCFLRPTLRAHAGVFDQRHVPHVVVRPPPWHQLTKQGFLEDEDDRCQKQKNLLRMNATTDGGRVPPNDRLLFFHESVPSCLVRAALLRYSPRQPFR